MKKGLLLELFEKFERARYEVKGVECWSARELQTILGYARWENFVNAIDKARKARETAGGKIADHFRDITKMIALAKTAQREVADIAPTRYACYFVR